VCLAVPSKVVEVHGDGSATVDTLGVRRRVSLDLLEEEVGEGDYVLVHVGFAIQKLDERWVRESMRLFGEILEQEG